jgi:HlyD family secretion protein
MLKTKSPLSLPPVKSDEFLPIVSRWTSFGGLILVSSVGIAIILTAQFEYNISVKAPAYIRPTGELRVVHSEMEGTVKSINIQINQVVRQGDVIARLDRSRLETQQSQLQGNIQQSQLQLAQIDAQIKLLDAEIAAESHGIDQLLVVAQAELNRDRRDHRERQITAQANLEEAEATLDFSKNEMQRYQKLVGVGAISQLQFEEKQAAVRTGQARLTRAKAALNPSEALVTIAQERSAQVRSKGRATLAALNRERESLIQRRLDFQTQLIRDQKELRQTKNELQKSIIRATSDGIIFQLNLRNAYQVVRLGDTIAKIAPNRNAFVIKAMVATQDIAQVKPGQTAQLRVHACPHPDYGILKGVVSAVSPDAITPNRAGIESLSTVQDLGVSKDAKYFEVTIQPDRFSLENGDRQCQLQSGMEAETNIISRAENLLQFILRKARLVTDL